MSFVGNEKKQKWGRQGLFDTKIKLASENSQS